jgi:hypothetical protein
LPSEQSPLQEKQRERADQELTPDLHDPQLCSESKAHSKRRRERAIADQLLTSDLHCAQLCSQGKAHSSTPDLHFSQLCSQIKAHSEKKRVRKRRSRVTLDLHYSQLCPQSKAHYNRRREGEQNKSAPLTSTIHSFALRAKPTVMQPRGGMVRAGNSEGHCSVDL